MSEIAEEQEGAGEAALHLLRHDIKNQLSNINLAVDQLRFELPEATDDDCRLYLEMIAQSCILIDKLLNSTQ